MIPLWELCRAYSGTLFGSYRAELVYSWVSRKTYIVHALSGVLTGLVHLHRFGRRGSICGWLRRDLRDHFNLHCGLSRGLFDRCLAQESIGYAARCGICGANEAA